MTFLQADIPFSQFLEQFFPIICPLRNYHIGSYFGSTPSNREYRAPQCFNMVKEVLYPNLQANTPFSQCFGCLLKVANSKQEKQGILRPPNG